MHRYLVLGGGLQGRTVANYLAGYGDNVTVGDIQPIQDIAGVAYQYFNANDVTGPYRGVMGTWFQDFDVVVGCLPSQFGAKCVSLAAAYGVNYVDLSFAEQDLFEYDPVAKLSGCTIIPDCGLAPGLPNLIAGNFMETLPVGKQLPPLDIFVGGNAEDESLPLGYVETWSLEDLYEEYVRPGRYVENGEIKTASPTDLNELRKVELGHGKTFEAFTSDGLRTLLKYKDVIPNMREYTLRHPYHMEAVKKLLQRDIVGADKQKKAFVDAFRSKLKPGNDQVFLYVTCGSKVWWLVVNGDDKLTAMTRSTAFTCAVMARFLAHRAGGTELRPGVVSLEEIGTNRHHFRQILEALQLQNIVLHGPTNNSKHMVKVSPVEVLFS